MPPIDRETEETLVAFLDGELPPEAVARLEARLAGEPELRPRLDELTTEKAALAAVLDALLRDAPSERLAAIHADAFAAIPIGPVPPALPARRSGILAFLPSLDFRWLTPIAAALVIVGFGCGWIGYTLHGDGPPETWREAVAEYWALTTADTLALEPSPELAVQQLALAGEKLGLALTPGAIALPGASFRGAELYDFEGRALTQIAYLDPQYGPIAYCVITDTMRRETQPTVTVMDGFSVVHWAGSGFGRMLIGHAPPEVLRAYADKLISQAGASASVSAPADRWRRAVREG